jgi:hypothetical protein
MLEKYLYFFLKYPYFSHFCDSLLPFSAFGTEHDARSHKVEKMPEKYSYFFEKYPYFSHFPGFVGSSLGIL